MLNIGFTNLFKNLPKIFIKFVLRSSSVATKKGKRVGRTEVANKASPFLAATKFVPENNIRQIVNIIKTHVNRYFFKFITKKFIFIYTP